MNKLNIAVFAGGCFWCTEAVFSKLDGVKNVVSGYTGGSIKNPAYREVCNGNTGHAEAVKIEFDKHIISYEELLEIFFATHNPTLLNQQGNDKGTQYRSAIFYADNGQKDQAESFIKLLTDEEVFKSPIVTEVKPLSDFYLAEDEHQKYYKYHKDQPYCQSIIVPKLKNLEKYYPHKLKTGDAL